MFAFGMVGDYPYILMGLFLLSTLFAVVTVLRSRALRPSVFSNALPAIFFALASAAYFSEPDLFLGAAFASMSIVWICLTIHAVMLKRRLRSERLQKLDRAVELLGRAMEGIQVKSPTDSSSNASHQVPPVTDCQ